jgi:hypothetical protein
MLKVRQIKIGARKSRYTNLNRKHDYQQKAKMPTIVLPKSQFISLKASC